MTLIEQLLFILDNPGPLPGVTKPVAGTVAGGAKGAPPGPHSGGLDMSPWMVGVILSALIACVLSVIIIIILQRRKVSMRGCVGEGSVSKEKLTREYHHNNIYQ